jgi:alpha-L-fucosidase
MATGCGERHQDSTPLAPVNYRRPKDFKPIRYKYSLIELKQQFSQRMMALAGKQWDKVKDVNDQGKWKPTQESLNKHHAPEWWEDAKFGMFIDWGPWSVAGWAPKKKNNAMYPDWYENHIYTDSATKVYHAKNWGKDFQQDDFIPLFKAKQYHPNQLAQIAKDAGMRYIIPFCKHHGGFCLWESSFTNRNAEVMGPHRDLIKPLIESCRSQGLKFGFYFSVEEWAYPLIDDRDSLYMRIWDDDARIFDKNTDNYSAKYESRASGKIAVKDYAKDYLVPQATEFIDKYDPDILWYDGDWITQVKDLRSFDIAAYFYNHAEGRKEVAVNDRYGMVGDKDLRSRMGDFYTSEYGGSREGAEQSNHPWEENRGISQSFGFNWQDNKGNVITTEAFLDMFIDIVSHGGNLLLIVNLDGQGALPEVQKERLKDIGKWLKVNGEGIYATRRWKNSVDGHTYFTKSKDGKFVYAICTSWPGNSLEIKNCLPLPGSKITMLGTQGGLKWEETNGNIRISIPSSLQDSSSRPCDYAWVMKIQINQ